MTTRKTSTWLSRLLLKLASTYGQRLSVEARLQLISAVLPTPPQAATSSGSALHAAGDEAAHSSQGPDLQHQRQLLWTLTELLYSFRGLLASERSEIRFPELAKSLKEQAQQLESAVTLLITAEGYGGLDLERGASQNEVRDAVARQHATEVDADLTCRVHVGPDDDQVWEIDYDHSNGALTAYATCTDPERHAPALHGFAPTPSAAADMVAGWSGGASVRFSEPPGDQPRLKEPSWKITAPHGPVQLATMLLERGGVCYDELMTACDRIRSNLRQAGDIEAWIRKRAAQLNHQTPHISFNHCLGQLPTPVHGHMMGFLNALEWVRPTAVLATYSDAWGEFGGHREGSLLDIVRGLAQSRDLETFVHEMFIVDPIDLTRIPGWAGPVYELGSGGGHRIHACRILELPWMLAQTHYTQYATQWHVARLCKEQGRFASSTERDRRMMLIEALNRRGIIDAEIIPDPLPLWTQVRCTRLPVAWLLRSPEVTAMLNTGYEQAYPGALERLGIPIETGTRSDEWVAWLLNDNDQ